MTMLRPAYRLEIGDRFVDTSDEPLASTTIELTVRLDMDTPADGFTVVQGQVGGLAPTTEQTTTIELGYDDDNLELVLTGRTIDVVSGFETKRIVGMSNGDLLLRHHENETFEDMTSGEIVEALCDRAGVTVARTDDGITLPAYVIDGRRSVLAHIRDLAALSGYDVYATQDGEVVFEEFAGERTSHRLLYGEHVIEADLRRTRSGADVVEVWGESPGSSRGDDSWAWLTKDFEPWRGASGTGATTELLELSAVRTAESAIATATRTLVGLERSAVTGRVRIQGRASVHLGDLVRLDGFPLDDLDDNYQVRSVEHRITKAGGFTTDVGFRSVRALAT